MDKQIYVIVGEQRCEYESEWDKTVIGVADKVDLSYDMIDSFYGKDKIKALSFDVVRDSGIETVSELEVLGYDGRPYNVIVTVMSFPLNKL